MSASTTLLRFQPSTMSTAQLAAVSFLARYAGRTHALYAFQLREWFSWCERNGLDPLVGVQRAHLELYIRGLGERGLMDSSVVTMMHEVRGYFRFAHRRADLGRPGDLRTPAQSASRRVPHPRAGPAHPPLASRRRGCVQSAAFSPERRGTPAPPSGACGASPVNRLSDRSE